MLIVLYTDATRFIIPNWLNAALLLLYPTWCLLGPVSPDMLSGLYAFGILFVFGYILFAFNIMGGGDIKLLMVLGLWLELSPALMEMLIYMGLLGGALSVGLLVARYSLPALGAKMEWKMIPRIFTHKEPVPYGLAIAIAFLITLWKGRVPSVPMENMFRLF